MKPILGTFSDPPGQARIDLARLLETRLLLQAGSGYGKSWALRRLLEQTCAGVQQFIVDPEGEFATLRERHGYVLAAVNGGDVVAHPRTAGLLARRLVEMKVSAVLDISELKKPERRRFVRLFLEELMGLPRAMWTPLMIAIDEIAEFAPEKDEAESLGAVIDLATRGRKRGFSLLGATQRIERFAKDAAAEMHNKLIGFTSLDLGVKRAAFELGMTPAQALAELRKLEPGDFYAIGPAITPTIRRLRIGDVQTTHPKPGTRKLQAPPKPTADIIAVLPKLADLPKEAEQEQKTLEDLRRELASTKRELTLARKAQPQPARPGASKEHLIAAEARGIERGVALATKELRKSFLAIRPTLIGTVDAQLRLANAALRDAIQKAFDSIQAPAAPSVTRAPSVTPVTRRDAVQRAASPPAQPRRGNGEDTGLTNPEQRILDAIAWLDATNGKPSQPATAVAFLARYKYGTGGFNNPRSSLRVKGLVEYVGSDLRLTDTGRALANAPAEALCAGELHQRVLGVLDDPQRRILKPLLDAYPGAIEAADVAAAANYKLGTGGFNNPRSRLRVLGLIEYHGSSLRASDVLFPDGALR